MRRSMFGMVRVCKRNMTINLRHQFLKKCFNVFKDVSIKEQKTKVEVADPVFNCMPIYRQQEFILENSPEIIKKKVVLETLPIMHEEDTSIRCLEIKDIQNIKFGSHLKITPQMHLDQALVFLAKRKGSMSSNASWHAASLVLANFLFFYGLRNNSHSINSNIVASICIIANEILKDEKLSEDIRTTWIALEAGHSNGYNNDHGLFFAKGWIKDAVTFSNSIVKLHNSKLFRVEDLIKFMERGYARKLKVLHEGQWIERRELLKDVEEAERLIRGLKNK